MSDFEFSAFRLIACKPYGVVQRIGAEIMAPLGATLALVLDRQVYGFRQGAQPKLI